MDPAAAEPSENAEDDFEWQLRQEQEEQWKRDNGYIYTDPNDGTSYEWDPDKQAWFPRVDDDFIASYQASYGIDPAQSQDSAAASQTEAQNPPAAVDPPPPGPADGGAPSEGEGGVKSADTEEAEPANREENQKQEKQQQQQQPQQLYRFQKMQMKRKAEEKTWFEIDPTKNTNVYVSGLPPDITPAEFQELMAKCGIIMVEEETEKPKVKLYTDEQGRPKGDGRCCYLKKESVDLAIQLLDEYDVRGHKIHVEAAHFTLKGDYKPSMKKKKKPSKKKKKGNQQEKLLDWRPEKKFARKRNEQVIILKHVFHPDEFEEDATLINDIKDDLTSECGRFGEVKKVLIFDRHPEGVASVKFKDAECADACITSLNGRWFAKRQLEVFTWDGRTDYKIEETDKEREERLKKWEDFLEDDDEEEKEAPQKGSTEEQKERAMESRQAEEDNGDDEEEEEEEDEEEEEEEEEEGKGEEDSKS